MEPAVAQKKLRGDGATGLEGHGRAEPRELLLEVLVAAQHVAGAVHDRGSLGHEPSEHQRRPASQIGRLDDGPREVAWTLDEGAMPAEEVYSGVHPVELLGDLEPVLVDVLGDDPRPGCL